MQTEKGVNLSRASVRLGVLAFAVIASAYAVADDSGWYVGANVGESLAKIDDSRIANALLSEGFAVTSITDDAHHVGFKLFGGYQFSRYFAVEGGYFDLGKFGFTANTLPPGALTGNLKVNGGNLDAVGILPFTDKFAAFARFGAQYPDARDHFAGYGAVIVEDPHRSDDALSYKFGFGLQYAFTRTVAMRLEAERYRIDDAVGNKGDIDLVSLGLLYRFGARPAPVVYVAPRPRPRRRRRRRRRAKLRRPLSSSSCPSRRRSSATAAFWTSSSRSNTTTSSAKTRRNSWSWGLS